MTSKSLIITEKPSVARDIVAALAGFHEREGYWESESRLVTYSVGHLVELLEPEDLDPAYKRWTLDVLPIIPRTFKHKPRSGMRERISVIRKLLERKDVGEVINACDAGREGELIFREIMAFIGSRKPVRRLWLQSMTREAIRQGFEDLEPGERYDPLGRAAACRSQSDWLIGMNATRALTKRLRGRRERGAWSAGRVQTPTLAILVEREREILAHVPRAFWKVEARFAAGSREDGHEYAATWFDPAFRAPEGDEDATDDRMFDEARACAIADAVRGAPGTARETRKPTKETAPPLFDLTSLQRECNYRYSWSARRALNAAQRCYEAHKVLTYPRTDSRCLPSDYRGKLGDVFRAFAKSGPFRKWAQRLEERGLENTERTFNDAGVTDHFAIIPTGVLPKVPLAGDDARLFDLVARRTLASFYPPAVWTRVERITEVGEHSFRSRSRTLDEAGWREVLGQTEQEDQPLPPLASAKNAEGVGVRNLDAQVQADQTKAPPRITEARLLSLMENAGRSVDDEELAAVMHEKGIGTPATRADIIENLISKDYVLRHGKALRPTVKGIRFIDVLRRIRVDRLASPELTGDMEFRLREIERGKRTVQEFMKEMTEYTTHVVDRTRDFDYDELYPNEQPIGTCPCERRRPVYERAWFYRCQEDGGARTDGDCEFRLWKDRAGRYLDRRTAATLLEKGETPVLDGFLTRDRRSYRGVLKLEGKELKLVPVSDANGERVSDEPEYEVNETPLGVCPACKAGEVVETPTEYRCSRRGDAGAEERCSFVLPRTICRREITRGEAESYVRGGRTEMLSDFISRYGRPFSAALYLKPNGRHGFEFAQRAPRAPRSASPGRRKKKAPGSLGRRAPKKAQASERELEAPGAEAPPSSAKRPGRAARKKAAPKRSGAAARRSRDPR